MKYFFLFLALTLALSSCKDNAHGAGSSSNTAAFDAAYPAVWSDLNLPEFRRGTLDGVTGKTEGVKTTHSVVITTDDSPIYVREFIEPAMEDLGWRSLQARKRLSKDISDDDLFFAAYVKGTNKLDINASVLPTGKTKIKIALAVFGSN